MSRLSASALLCVGLLCTLGVKGRLNETLRPAVDRDEREPVIAFLQSQAFAIEPLDSDGSPVWTAGRRNGCSVRVADVSPQGWHRDIVAQQASGHSLHYTFAGRFYDSQPVKRTLMDFYWRRLGRSIGLDWAPSSVRAVISDPRCAEDDRLLEKLAMLP